MKLVDAAKEEPGPDLAFSKDDLEAIIHLIEEDGFDEIMANVVDEVVMKVAIDSGSCANVAHPDDLPPDCILVPKAAHEKDFNGAGGDRIKRYGKVKAVMTGKEGSFMTDWNAAEVTRALHSVSTICGPEDHPVGLHDVLFNNTDCFVVPPGVVRAIMTRLKAIVNYKREGGLYLASLTVSSFTRPGQQE